MTSFQKVALTFLVLALAVSVVHAANGDGGPTPTRPGTATTGPTVVAVTANMVGLTISIPSDSGTQTNSKGQSIDWGADPVLDWIVTYTTTANQTAPTSVTCTGVVESPCPTANGCGVDIGSDCTKTRNTVATCLIDGLQPDTPYSFTVRARNPQGLSDPSVATPKRTLTLNAVPGTPNQPSINWFTTTEVSVNAVTSGGLPWGAPLNHGRTPINAYRVSVMDGETEVNSEESACPRNIIVGNLEQGKQYSIVSRAKNGSDQQSEPSPSKQFNTSTGTVPSAPSTPLMQWFTSTRVFLTWSAPQDQGNARVQQYQITQTGGKTLATKTTPAATTCGVVTELTPGAGKPNVPTPEGTPQNRYGEAYRFRVRASNDGTAWSEESSQSNPVSLPLAEAPNAGPEPNIVWYTASEMRLSWNDIPLTSDNNQAARSHGVDQIVAWVVKVTPGVEDGVPVNTVSAIGSPTVSNSGQTYGTTISALEPGTQYTFEIKGKNSLGTVSDTTGATKQQPTAALNEVPDPVTNANVKLIYYSLRNALLQWSIPSTWKMGGTRVTTFKTSVTGLGENTFEQPTSFVENQSTYTRSFSFSVETNIAGSTSFQVVAENTNDGSKTSSASAATPVQQAGAPSSNTQPNKVANGDISVIAYNSNTVILRWKQPTNMNAALATQYEITPVVNCGDVGATTNECPNAAAEQYNGFDGIVPRVTEGGTGKEKNSDNGNVFGGETQTGSKVQVPFLSGEEWMVKEISGLQSGQQYNFKVTSINKGADNTDRISDSSFMTTEVTLPNTTPDAPTDLNTAGLEQNDATSIYKLKDGFVIEFSEPVNHGESAISATNGYTATFYKLTTDTVNGQANTPFFTKLSSTCSISGIRIGQPWERNNQNAAKIRGACTGNGITSEGDSTYRFDVRATNSVGTGVPTLRRPSGTTTTNGVITPFRADDANPGGASADMIYHFGNQAWFRVTIMRPNTNLWTNVQYSCSGSPALCTSSDALSVGEVNQLRYSMELENPIDFNIPTGTTDALPVTVTFTFTNGVSGASASTATETFNLNPEQGNTASSPGTPTVVELANNDAGWRSPLWQTSTSAKFLVKSNADMGSQQQQRYIFEVSSTTTKADNPNTVRRRLRCMSSLTSDFGVLFGEMNLKVDSDSDTDFVLGNNDVNTAYWVRPDSCIIDTDLDNSEQNDTKRGRVTSYTAKTGSGTNTGEFDVAYGDIKPKLQVNPTLGGLTPTEAWYAIWVDGSCNIPLVCKWTETPVAGGTSAAECYGGTGCSKTPALNGGLGMIKMAKGNVNGEIEALLQAQNQMAGSAKPVASFNEGFKVGENHIFDKLTILGAFGQGEAATTRPLRRIAQGCGTEAKVTVMRGGTEVNVLVTASTQRYIPFFTDNVAFDPGSAQTNQIKTARSMLKNSGTTCTTPPFISVLWNEFTVDAIEDNTTNRGNVNNAIDGINVVNASSGAVMRVKITNGGGGYTEAPTVEFTGAPTGGTTAVGTAVLGTGTEDGNVIEIQLTGGDNTGGSGYLETPSITIASEGGKQATAVAFLNNRFVALGSKSCDVYLNMDQSQNGSTVTSVTGVKAAECTNAKNAFEFLVQAKLNSALSLGLWRMDVTANADVAPAVFAQTSETWGEPVSVMWPGYGCTISTGVGQTAEVLGTSNVATLIPYTRVFQRQSIPAAAIYQYFEVTKLHLLSTCTTATGAVCCKYAVRAQACSSTGGTATGNIGDGTGNEAQKVCSTFNPILTNAAVDAFSAVANKNPDKPNYPSGTLPYRPRVLTNTDAIRGSLVQRVIGSKVTVAVFSPRDQGTSKVTAYGVQFQATVGTGGNVSGNPNAAKISDPISVSDLGTNGEDFTIWQSSDQLVFSQTYTAKVRSTSAAGSGDYNDPVSFTTAALTPDQIGNNLSSPSGVGLDGVAGIGQGSSRPAVINYTSTNVTVAYFPPRRHGKSWITKYQTIPWRSTSARPTCADVMTSVTATSADNNNLKALSQTNGRLLPFGKAYHLQVIPWNAVGPSRGGQLNSNVETNDNEVPAMASNDNTGCSTPATVQAYGSALQTLCWSKNSNFGKDVVTEYRITSFTGSVGSMTNSTVYPFSNPGGERAGQRLMGNMTNLTPSTEYAFRVQARNTAGYSTMTGIQTDGQGNQITIRTSNAAIPGVPRNLVAIRHNMDSVTLQWDLNLYTSYSGGSQVLFYVVKFSARGFGAEGFAEQTKQIAAPTSMSTQPGVTMTTIAGLASSEGEQRQRIYVFSVRAINRLPNPDAPNQKFASSLYSPAVEQATASSEANKLTISMLLIVLMSSVALFFL